MNMEAITDQRLFELYNDTLSKCGMYLFDEEDDVVEYNIFEEFDIGVHSFLHIDSLNRLYKNGFISPNKLTKSITLRDKVIQLQNSNEWAIESFRTSKKWQEILLLCDEIKATL